MFQSVYHLTLITGIQALDFGYTVIPNPGARPGIPWVNAFSLRTSVVY